MTVCNLLTATGLYMVITKLWPIIKHIIPLKHRWAILLPPTLRLQPLSSNYCYVTGKWHLERTVGNAEGYYTLLFKKIEGQWVIISDHSS